MSDEVLWYAARVSGLMTWILACCALIAGLLISSQRDDRASPSRVWAGDAYRFLGITSLAFLAAHVAAIVLNPIFDLSIAEALSGRDGQGWLASGVVIAAATGWLLLVVELLRNLERRAPRWFRPAIAIAALGVVVGGVVHAWSDGSDVRNPFAIVVVAIFIIAILAAASLAFGSPDEPQAIYGGMTEQVPQHTDLPLRHRARPPLDTTANGARSASLSVADAADPWDADATVTAPLPAGAEQNRSGFPGSVGHFRPTENGQPTPASPPIQHAAANDGGKTHTTDPSVGPATIGGRAEIPLPNLQRSREVGPETASGLAGNGSNGQAATDNEHGLRAEPRQPGAGLDRTSRNGNGSFRKPDGI